MAADLRYYYPLRITEELEASRLDPGDYLFRGVSLVSLNAATNPDFYVPVNTRISTKVPGEPGATLIHPTRT